MAVSIAKASATPRSWIAAMKLWWVLLGNGAISVLVIYGVYLIIIHH